MYDAYVPQSPMIYPKYITEPLRDHSDAIDKASALNFKDNEQFSQVLDLVSAAYHLGRREAALDALRELESCKKLINITYKSAINEL